jgi:hypothetical protein
MALATGAMASMTREDRENEILIGGLMEVLPGVGAERDDGVAVSGAAGSFTSAVLDSARQQSSGGDGAGDVEYTAREV